MKKVSINGNEYEIGNPFESMTKEEDVLRYMYEFGRNGFRISSEISLALKRLKEIRQNEH